eukprot:15123723-Ditylum_brightwellii.AAC.1
MKPFCKITIEEAIRLKNPKLPLKSLSFPLDPKVYQNLMTALALGCDHAVYIHTPLCKDYMELQLLSMTKKLENVVENKEPDWVVLGKQSIDGEVTGPIIAGLLNWAQVTFVAV